MDKEKKAYETLVQIVGARIGAAPGAEEAHHEHPLKLLHQLHIAGENLDSQTMAHLAQLLVSSVQEGVKEGGPEANAWMDWLNELLLSNKLALGGPKADELIQWLLLRADEHNGSVDTLRCLCTLLKLAAMSSIAGLAAVNVRKYWTSLAAIKIADSVDAMLLLVLCLDTVFSASMEAEDLKLSSQVANALIQVHYVGLWQQRALAENATQMPQLLQHTLQLLAKIALHNPQFVEQQTPELFGLVLAYVQFSTEHDGSAVKLQMPHRVQPTQQTAVYADDEEEPINGQRSNGGRQPKTRKMRSIKKRSNTREHQAPVPTSRDQELFLLLTSNDYGADRTGESEGQTQSDEPTTLQPRQLNAMQERHRQAKVRSAALQLLAAMVKQLPKRSLYGYWHILFPSDCKGNCSNSLHLLHIGQTDGNGRCRALALQVAGQVIYGSRSYLSQASSIGASNYTNFAVNLSNSLLSAYRTLAQILSREYAPPVLTQSLKCLAVLVQATPFEHLDMGLVYQFVPEVKKLLRHVEATVQVSALLVMELLVATPRLTQEIACAVGLPSAHQVTTKLVNTAPRLNVREQELKFADLCDILNDAELEAEDEEVEEEEQQEQQLEKKEEQNEQKEEKSDEKKHNSEKVQHPEDKRVEQNSEVPRNSWLLRYVFRQLESVNTATPLRVECLQVLLAMATHFGLLQDHLESLYKVLCLSLTDNSPDVRLYAARCLEGNAYQMSRHVLELPELWRAEHSKFWQNILRTIYSVYVNVASPTLKCALCDALSNMGAYCFERLPEPQRNGLLAFLSGCSGSDNEEHQVRASALRALAVYLLHPTLRNDLVFVENTAELTLRLAGDPQLLVRTKAAWALGNISDALVTPLLEFPSKLPKERISTPLLYRLIECATSACSDHDKVRANGVRALGNLLRLLSLPERGEPEEKPEVRDLMQRALNKLIDCARAAGSAKVKWNACYAIGSLVRCRALFAAGNATAATLYPAICQLMVQHANFKVRINATSVLLHIRGREDFGQHFGTVWRALLEATERSNALESFEEYNHRDALQQQLCLAIAHLLELARAEDLPGCWNELEGQLDVVSGTWVRVAHRIVPEKAAPLYTCAPLLQQRMQSLSGEQRTALASILKAVRLEG
ncbi:HEAT repeat-containing protein 6 [Scaptodrosophila lebanonensis]|uniref:HEAT repeat-containing protein 6 n=1 Tax=Drosophila lebanonensis TaxID=7225 RepID=A0A6J2TSH7_DROLE|nr:HEAT repeat-containing protein 6 [Scaptodrosophila lebanonensis]